MGFFGVGALPIRAWVSSAIFVKEVAVPYLLRATWDSASNQGYANAQVLDTVGEGVEDGSLTVVEVDGTLAVVSNKCAFTAQATASWGALGLYSQAITRTLGYTLIHTINVGGTSTRSYTCFNDTADLALGSISSAGVHLRNTIQAIYVNGVSTSGIGAYAINTDYLFAIVLGGYDSNGVPWRSGETAANYLYGSSIYVKGGAYTDWTLLWRYDLENDGTVYTGFSNFNSVGTLDDFRVPDQSLEAVLQPTALSTFTASNGTSLDAITPEVGGGWTEQSGDWDIQGNRTNIVSAVSAIATATIDTSISDVMIDVIVNGEHTGDDPGIIIRYSNDDNFWLAIADVGGDAISIYERNGGGWTQRATAGVVINAFTDYDLRIIGDGQNIDAFLDGGNKITYGSASLNETETIHGIYGTVADCKYDNFAVYPRTSTTFDDEFDAV